MRSLAAIAFALLSAFTFTVAQDKPAHRWSANVYWDFVYNVGRDTGIAALGDKALSGNRDFQAFLFRRIYVTLDSDINSTFAFRFRLEADEAANTSNGKIGTFVKDAYLRWKGIFAGSDLTAGIQPTSAFEVSEGVWGYRSLEKTILDLHGIVSSRDQGISLRGNLYGEGMAKYWVMFANGSGNNPETDRYKRTSVQIELHPISDVTATLYGDLAARAPKVSAGTAFNNDAIVGAVCVGYKVKDDYTAGVEGFVRTIEHQYSKAGSLVAQSSFGVSVFGSYVMRPGVTVVARYDSYDPNTDGAASGDARGYLLVGCDWSPERNVSIIPNIQMETYEQSSGGRAIDPSVTARVTFAYSF